MENYNKVFNNYSNPLFADFIKEQVDLFKKAGFYQLAAIDNQFYMDSMQMEYSITDSVNFETHHFKMINRLGQPNENDKPMVFFTEAQNHHRWILRASKPLDMQFFLFMLMNPTYSESFWSMPAKESSFCYEAKGGVRFTKEAGYPIKYTRHISKLDSEKKVREMSENALVILVVQELSEGELDTFIPSKMKGFSKAEKQDYLMGQCLAGKVKLDDIKNPRVSTGTAAERVIKKKSTVRKTELKAEEA